MPAKVLDIFHSVQLLGRVQLFATPWTAARQASLSITNSQSLLKLISIVLVIPFNRESQFLGRLIRSLGSPRRRKGSGTLKEEGRTNIFFFSTFLSLSHIKHIFSLSPELMITRQTTQFKLCTKDYITTM